MTQNLSHFWRIFLSVPSKYTSKCRRELSEDGVLWRLLASISFENFELKRFDFAHEISTSLSKLLPNSLEEMVEDNFFQERNNIYLFSDFDQNFFWLCIMTFQQGCQKCIWRCYMNTSRNENFASGKTLSLMFSDLDQLFSKTFLKTFGRNCSKFFQGVEMTLLSKFVLRSSCTSNFFSLSAENLLTLQKNCACQNSFLLVRMKMFLDLFSLEN